LLSDLKAAEKVEFPIHFVVGCYLYPDPGLSNGKGNGFKKTQKKTKKTKQNKKTPRFFTKEESLMEASPKVRLKVETIPLLCVLDKRASIQSYHGLTLKDWCTSMILCLQDKH
jgi:hypothetical protein